MTEISYGLGLRQDKLDWNIASDTSGTSTPNILSELKWDVKSVEFTFNLDYYSESHFHFLFNGNYGFYSTGENQDSDYLGNNRTSEFSRSVNSADGSYATGAMLAFGYRIGPMPGQADITIGLIPLIGYGRNVLHTKMTDGNQVIATSGVTPDVGPFPNLDSRYTATFDGGIAGAEFYIDSHHSWRFFLNYYYHQAKYHGEGNWNLRSDLAHPVSFAHDADGTGSVINIGMNFSPSVDWSTSLMFGYEKWHTSPGTDTTYKSNGTRIYTRFNEANWEVKRLLFSVLYSF